MPVTWTPPRLPLRMLPRQGEVTISWEKGIDQSEEDDEIPPGSATILHNWVPEAPGALRVRRGWLGVTSTKASDTWHNFSGGNVSTTWPPAHWKVKSAYFASNLGADHSAWWLISIINDSDSTNPDQLWAIKTGTITQNAEGFYGSQPYAPPPGPTQTPSYPGPTMQQDTATSQWYPVHGWNFPDEPTQDFDSYPLAFAKGIQNVLFTHPYFGATEKWDGQTPAQVVKMDPGTVQVPPYGGDLAHAGRAIAFHKRRFFVGGDDAVSGVPWRLYYSDINASATWKKGGDFMFEDIGADDGTAIEDLVGWNQSLIIGKAYRIYALSGGGPSNFDMTPIDGMNACQGRSLVPTPQGLIVCGDRDVWLFDGSNPLPISHPVLDLYAAGADDWRQACYVDGMVYITQHAAPNTMLCFDLARGVWHTESVSYTSGIVAVTSVNKRMVTGPFSSTVNPMTFRDFPDSMRERDDFGGDQDFQARVDRLFVSEEGAVTIRNIYIRTRQRAGQSGRLKVTPIFDGADDTHPFYINADPTSPTVKVSRLDHGRTCKSLGFQFDLTATDSTTALFDIQSIKVIYDPLPAR